MYHHHHSANGSRRYSKLKAKYRTILVRLIIIALGNNKVIPKFSILTTFVNCFKKAKISATSQIEAINDSNAHLVISNINLMSSQEKDSSLLQGDSAESFVNFDNDVQNSNGVILKKRY